MIILIYVINYKHYYNNKMIKSRNPKNNILLHVFQDKNINSGYIF